MSKDFVKDELEMVKTNFFVLNYYHSSKLIKMQLNQIATFKYNIFQTIISAIIGNKINVIIKIYKNSHVFSALKINQ